MQTTPRDAIVTARMTTFIFRLGNPNLSLHLLQLLEVGASQYIHPYSINIHMEYQHVYLAKEVSIFEGAYHISPLYVKLPWCVYIYICIYTYIYGTMKSSIEAVNPLYKTVQLIIPLCPSAPNSYEHGEMVLFISHFIPFHLMFIPFSSHVHPISSHFIPFSSHFYPIFTPSHPVSFHCISFSSHFHHQLLRIIA